MDRIVTTSVISFDSTEKVRKSLEIARDAISLNHEVCQNLTTFKSGKKHISQRVNLLGEYFERIEIAESSDGLSFSITFTVLPNVDSHWKYMMMAVLRSVKYDLASIETRSIVTSA